MAGCRLTVCLPGGARDRLVEAVGEAMAPFEIGGPRPYSDDLWIWDHWWITGGADDGGYPIRPGHEADPRIIHDQPLRDGTRRPSRPGWCTGGPRGLLALGEPQKRAAELAGIAWDRWHEMAAEHPPGRPWEEFAPASALAPETAYDLRVDSEARHAGWERYLAQPPAPAFRAWLAGLPDHLDAGFFREVLRHVDDPLRRVGGYGREEFLAFGADRAVAHGNVLTLDGWWCEKGYDPVHGACDDQGACPHTPPYTQRPGAGEAHLAGLPDDTLLVHVRCHV
ncbi:hypothetical protein ACFWWM_07000 [Streptomyces sp. NPDC058682]|uniref:hypothetical protein n=1 Tax=Streptomyces sp. NPDC058682 TaxID=3346596 RepID=UPI0036462E4E